MSQRFLTVAEVAKLTETPERTVRRWCLRGAIPSARLDSARAWRIPLDALRDRADLLGYASREDAFDGY